ncbi:MAG: hypothetical protein BAA03_11260 [Caldibacillus debilis]|nr:MAG: hypothetical protein BAA03_11260 [Caldibacillus debilis]
MKNFLTGPPAMTQERDKGKGQAGLAIPRLPFFFGTGGTPSGMARDAQGDLCASKRGQAGYPGKEEKKPQK